MKENFVLRRTPSVMNLPTLNFNKVAIFGGTGMTGLCAVQEALNRGFSVKLLVRDPEKLPKIFHHSVEMVNGDVTNLEDVRKTVSDVHAVIVALGTRNNLEPTTELSNGLKNIVTAMKEKQLRVISTVLSAFLFREPEQVPAVFKNINEEHSRMLNVLLNSELDYIAVFPPHISDNPKSKYTTKIGESPGGKVISKYELGEFLVECLQFVNYYQKIVGICTESCIPIEGKEKEK